MIFVYARRFGPDVRLRAIVLFVEFRAFRMNVVREST
jgi:hypothetical protein